MYPILGEGDVTPGVGTTTSAPNRRRDVRFDPLVSRMNKISFHHHMHSGSHHAREPIREALNLQGLCKSVVALLLISTTDLPTPGGLAHVPQIDFGDPLCWAGGIPVHETKHKCVFI